MELSRKDLCALVAEICRQIKAESGSKAYHGGIYPENISCSPDGKIERFCILTDLDKITVLWYYLGFKQM